TRSLALERRLVVGAVRHVLPDALVTSAAKPNHGRSPLELGGDCLLERLEIVPLDFERKAWDPVVETHSNERYAERKVDVVLEGDERSERSELGKPHALLWRCGGNGESADPLVDGER